MRLAYIDFLKGASISLVVLYHCSLFLEANGFESNAVDHAMNALSLVRMPVFFFVSGYLSTNIVNRSWGEVLKGRVLTFAWLFGLWTILRYLYFGLFVNNTLNPDDRFGLTAFALSYVNPDTQLWFLWALAIYTILAKLTVGVPRWVVISGALVISASAYYAVIETYSHQQTYLLRYSIFFFAALLFKPEITSLIQNRPMPALVASLALIMASALMAIAFAVPVWVLRMPLSVSASVATIIAAASLCGPGRVNDAVVRIGTMSLPIYLAHTFFIAALANIAAALLRPSVPTTIGLLLVIALASIALSILLYRVVRALGIVGLYELPRGRLRPELSVPAGGSERRP